MSSQKGGKMVEKAEDFGMWTVGQLYGFTTTDPKTGEHKFFTLELIRIDENGALFLPPEDQDAQKVNVMLALMSKTMKIKTMEFKPKAVGDD